MVKVQVKILSPQNRTLDESTRTQINYTKEQLLESNKTTLAGFPAREIIFTDLGL